MAGGRNPTPPSGARCRTDHRDLRASEAGAAMSGADDEIAKLEDKRKANKAEQEAHARAVKLAAAEAKMELIKAEIAVLRDGAEQTSAIVATPFKWVDPATLPRDKWLYGYFLQRGFVSLTIATGGTGKSVLSIAEALAMISGQTLLHDVAHEKLRVWLINLEDPILLLQKRVTAAALQYEVAPEMIEQGLFLDSGLDQEVKIAVAGRDGAVIVEPVYDAIVDTIRKNKIDVVIVDPFVSSHSVNENDNSSIDAVVKRWSKIAHVTNCAVHLIHHSRKPGGEAVSTEHSR